MSGSLLPNLGLTGDIADHATWGLEGRANDRRLDSLVMPAVKSVTNTPPGSPANGDRYIVGTSPTGAWSANANAIATWNATLAAWTFYTPKAGWAVYDVATKLFRRYTSSWFSGELALNVRQFGVVGDGVTDDEPALNALFDQVAALSLTGGISQGPATVYFPKGTYFIKSMLVPDGESLSSPISGLRIIADPGTVIKAATPAQGGVWTGSRSAFLAFRTSATPATDVIIEGLTFDGQSFGTFDLVVTGIYTTAITGLIVRDCTFKNLGDITLGAGAGPRNDGIILGDNAPGFVTSMRAKDVRIEKCRFINCVRNGISMLDVDGVVVEGCHFEDTGNSCIDAEPNVISQFARNITIDNCTFTDWEAQAVVIIPGSTLIAISYPAQMEGLKITNCIMDGATEGIRGILVFNWIDVDVSNNTVLRATTEGIYIRGCVGARIHGNHVRDITGAASTSGIKVDKPQTPQPQDHSITNNTLKNISGYGMRIIDLDTGSIVGNSIRNYDTISGNRPGISIVSDVLICKNIAVVANTVVGGALAVPIFIDSDCTRMLCVGNICQENGGFTVFDSIDNEAASTIHALNCDDQRADRLFSSASGTTPLAGGPIGQNDQARKVVYDVTVAAGAGASGVSTVSAMITSASVCNILFSPRNAAAAELMGSAVGVFCSRTATGFDLIHGANTGAVGATNAAIFVCYGVIM